MAPSMRTGLCPEVSHRLAVEPAEQLYGVVVPGPAHVVCHLAQGASGAGKAGTTRNVWSGRIIALVRWEAAGRSTARCRWSFHASQARLTTRTSSEWLKGFSSTSNAPLFITSDHKRSSASREATISSGGMGSPAVALQQVFPVAVREGVVADDHRYGASLQHHDGLRAALRFQQGPLGMAEHVPQGEMVGIRAAHREYGHHSVRLRSFAGNSIVWPRVHGRLPSGTKSTAASSGVQVNVKGIGRDARPAPSSPRRRRCMDILWRPAGEIAAWRPAHAASERHNLVAGRERTFSRPRSVAPTRQPQKSVRGPLSPASMLNVYATFVNTRKQVLCCKPHV